ncbi:MAG TPA: ABC transporter substrate-binding protein [Thermomicrobiales bacterium]|nr:ABC transporter substrate-binding protein [Thermomicrobiales bacterium]
MDQNDIRNSVLERAVSRRRFLGTSGAAFAAAMLAGGALPSGFGRAVMAQDGGSEFHSAWPYLDPGAGGHFNTFVTNGIMNPPNIYGDLMYVPMGMLYWANNEWLPLLATEWAFIQTGTATPGASPAATPEASPSASPAAGGIDLNADTLQVKLRQDVTWSDDAPFNAQDVVDTFWVLRIMSNTVWEYIDDVQALDDYTVNFHMAKPATVVERYVVRTSPRPSSVYGEWAQKARDLFGGGKTLDDPEGKQLLDQFNQFRPENVPVTGPYTIDAASITNAQFNMPKNDKSVYADMAKFDTIVNFNGETDTISAVVLSKDIDYATHGFAPATEKEMIANEIRVLRPPTYGGAALLFNFGQLKEFEDKKVRQALAHAIDRDRAGQISLADSGVGVKMMAGMSDNLVAQWVAESNAAELNQYEYDQEKAAALLQEAGWTKDGDIWKTPDGKDAAYELAFPAEFADYSATGQDLSEQLTEFGFQISPRAITHTQIGIDVDQGKFQLAIQGWGSSTNPHPHYSFTTAFFTHNTLALNNGGKGMAFPLEQETDVAGSVDINALVVASAEGLDEEQQRAQVTTIAQVFNELLNIIPIYERYGNNAALAGLRVAEWPADDDPILKNSPYADGIPTMLMLTGKLEPAAGT